MKDSKDILTCPACGSQMAKIKAPDGDFFIDICLDGCGGIYFDNRELEKFDEKNENIDFIEEALQGKVFKKVDQGEKRICPSCKTPMVKTFASSKKEIEIDTCYSCGGKFLDFGELEKLRQQFETDSDRSAAFNQEFAKQYSMSINQAEREALSREKNRSFTYGLFKAIFESGKIQPKSRNEILKKL